MKEETRQLIEAAWDDRRRLEEERVREAIRRTLEAHPVAVGYASCACGGDILFLEEVLRAGGRVVVLPPLPLPAAIEGSVAFAGADWVERLHRLLDSPAATLLDAEGDATGEDDNLLYDYCNRQLAGLAVLKARQLELPLRAMAVWNGVESGLPGGTDSAVARWHGLDIPIDVIPPIGAAS